MHDFLPIPPLMKAGKIVATNDPDKAASGVALLKGCDGVDCVAAVPLAFDVRDHLACFMGDRIAGCKTGFDRAGLPRLQRVLWADQPDYFIEPERFSDAAADL